MVNFSISYPFKGARAGYVCLFWSDSPSAHWVDIEWDSPSTESTRSETPRQLSQCGVRLHVNWVNAEGTAFPKISPFRVDSVDVESHSVLTQSTWSLTRRWLSWWGTRLGVNWVSAECQKIWISRRIQVQNRKHSKALLFGLCMFDQFKKLDQKNLMQVYL